MYQKMQRIYIVIINVELEHERFVYYCDKKPETSEWFPTLIETIHLILFTLSQSWLAKVHGLHPFYSLWLNLFHYNNCTLLQYKGSKIIPPVYTCTHNQDCSEVCKNCHNHYTTPSMTCIFIMYTHSPKDTAPFLSSRYSFFLMLLNQFITLSLLSPVCSTNCFAVVRFRYLVWENAVSNTDLWWVVSFEYLLITCVVIPACTYSAKMTGLKYIYNTPWHSMLPFICVHACVRACVWVQLAISDKFGKGKIGNHGNRWDTWCRKFLLALLCKPPCFASPLRYRGFDVAVWLLQCPSRYVRPFSCCVAAINSFMFVSSTIMLYCWYYAVTVLIIRSPLFLPRHFRFARFAVAAWLLQCRSCYAGGLVTVVLLE